MCLLVFYAHLVILWTIAASALATGAPQVSDPLSCAEAIVKKAAADSSKTLASAGSAAAVAAAALRPVLAQGATAAAGAVADTAATTGAEGAVDVGVDNTNNANAAAEVTALPPSSTSDEQATAAVAPAG